MKIIVATGNKDKVREIKSILNNCDKAFENVELYTMKEAGIIVDIDENGTTFEENSLIKARAVASKCDCAVLADDSGLEVDYLDKAPGIYSARFMGEDTPYKVKNQAIIDKLDGVPDEKRTARFVCSVACVLPDGTEHVLRQTMEGRIGYKEEGTNGFGYDPIFFLPEYGCSSSVISMEEKNKISHRGKAFREMAKYLKENNII